MTFVKELKRELDHICYVIGDILSLLIGKEEEWRRIKQEEIKKEREKVGK